MEILAPSVLPQRVVSEVDIARSYVGACRAQLRALRDCPANAERIEQAERARDAAEAEFEELKRLEWLEYVPTLSGHRLGVA